MPSTASASAPAPAAAGLFRAALRSSQLANGNERREIDARLVEPGDKLFEPRAPRRERQLAQILIAVGEKIVGAQMRGKLGHQFFGDGFAIEPLLQHVERLHALVAHDQKLAIDGAGKPQRFDEIGKAPGNVFAGAGIEPPNGAAVMLGGDRLDANAVPFPFGHEIGRVERGKIGLVDGMREHRRPERRRIARSPAFRRGLPARRKARRRAAPSRARALRCPGHRWRRAPPPRPWQVAPTRRCAIRR